jgi:hypothetical protein
MENPRLPRRRHRRASVVSRKFIEQISLVLYQGTAQPCRKYLRYLRALAPEAAFVKPKRPLLG